VDSSKFKSLNTRRKELVEETTQLSKKIVETKELRDKKEHELYAINKQIEQMQKGVIITEHAILRYLERGADLDVDNVKKLILNEATRAKIEQYESGEFPIGDGLSVKVKNKVIVTVLKN